MDGLKLPNYPLLELTVFFSKVINKISFTVAATSDFSSEENLISKTRLFVNGPAHNIPVFVEVKFFYNYLS